MTARRTTAIAAAAALAFACWWWWPTDARRIRTQLHEMASALSAEGDRSDLARLAGLAAVGGQLAPDVVVEVREREARGRDAVLSAARAFLVSAPGRIVLDEVEVQVSGGTAVADVVATLVHQDGREAGTELTIDLARGDRSWMVRRVKELAPLQRPDRGP